MTYLVLDTRKGDRCGVDAGGLLTGGIFCWGNLEVDSFNDYLLKTHYVLNILLDTTEGKKMDKKLFGFML